MLTMFAIRAILQRRFYYAENALNDQTMTVYVDVGSQQNIIFTLDFKVSILKQYVDIFSIYKQTNIISELIKMK